ncbi:DUF2292 domain-containing protein [Cohnella endophytica]|uniref:DUF2292 domain-containing protein n=1 Tax=Cohnella endophytica TaxID=2419778 RepID=A0A494XZK2_9BACL|nr:YezD family protein [Cohnella endophytica]RKP55188.1 DUF2292 domain-containing protein [Cohnella endophytica]
MADSPLVDHALLRYINDSINSLKFGNIQITVHDGRVVQIDKTERKRYEADASLAQKQKKQAGEKRSATGG